MDQTYKELVNLVLSYDYIMYYENQSKNKTLNDYYANMLNNKVVVFLNNNEIINNYINILIKHNKININDIKEFDNINKVYETFINSEYLYNILLEKYYDLRLCNETKHLLVYQHLIFDINSFSNDFYETLLKSDNITNQIKYKFINMLSIHNDEMFIQLCLSTLLYYQDDIPIEEFINKHNSIKTNYKLIVSIIKFVNKFNSDENKNEHILEYYIPFYNELINYLGYNVLLNNQCLSM